MTKTMNLNNNLNLESESPTPQPNTNQQMKNSIRLNQKLKNRLKIANPQIFHIGCFLCSMRIQVPLDGQTILENSRFWTRKNWPKCGARGKETKE